MKKKCGLTTDLVFLSIIHTNCLQELSKLLPTCCVDDGRRGHFLEKSHCRILNISMQNCQNVQLNAGIHPYSVKQKQISFNQRRRQLEPSASSTVCLSVFAPCSGKTRCYLISHNSSTYGKYTAGWSAEVPTLYWRYTSWGLKMVHKRLCRGRFDLEGYCLETIALLKSRPSRLLLNKRALIALQGSPCDLQRKENPPDTHHRVLNIVSLLCARRWVPIHI